MSPDAETPAINWDEVAEHSENLTEADAADEYLAEQEAKKAAEVTEPVTAPLEGDVLPPAPRVEDGIVIEAKPADLERVKDYVEQPDVIDVPADAVSASPEPIKLAEDIPPAHKEMRIMTIGNVDVIASPERIEYLQRNGIGEPVRMSTPVKHEPPAMPPRITDAILAEQEAGRAALARHALNAGKPRAEPSANELAAKGKTVPVYRPGVLTHVQQRHMLNSPKAGKGEKY
jgi:hypothetical protein